MDLDVGRLALEAARAAGGSSPASAAGEALALRPPASSTAPMLAAWPTQIVLTSGLMNCIVS